MTPSNPQPVAADPAPRASVPRSARNRFLAALGLFAIWIVVLATMAVLSADRPESRAPTPGPGPAGVAPGDAEAPGR